MNPNLLAHLAIVLVAAKLGGELFERIKQPAVLGELLAGILIGNLHHLGVPRTGALLADPAVALLAELGVVVLLFQVGLESDAGEMLRVGAASFVVAIVGVVTPMLLGFGAAALLRPDLGIYAHIFIGAILCATSVGITARVFKDLGVLGRKESRIVLGAAVLDDVMGLVVLALVKGLIEAHNHGTPVDGLALAVIIGKALGFLGGALVLGRLIGRRVLTVAARLQVSGLLLVVALSACFVFSYFAAALGLATIVGAFAAGLMLDRVQYKTLAEERGEHGIEDAIQPIATFLVPLFFVRMGMSVDLGRVGDPATLGFAAVLIVAAVVGKQVCGLAVFERGLDRLTIGIGMIPRGEVGLILAGIGGTTLVDGHPVVDGSIFAATVVMVLVTTVMTPPLLTWAMRRHNRPKSGPIVPPRNNPDTVGN